MSPSKAFTRQACGESIFAHYERIGGSIAESFFCHGLCLPSGSNLSPEDLARVVAVVRRTF